LLLFPVAVKTSHRDLHCRFVSSLVLVHMFRGLEGALARHHWMCLLQLRLREQNVACHHQQKSLPAGVVAPLFALLWVSVGMVSWLEMMMEGKAFWCSWIELALELCRMAVVFQEVHGFPDEMTAVRRFQLPMGCCQTAVVFQEVMEVAVEV